MQESYMVDQGLQVTYPRTAKPLILWIVPPLETTAFMGLMSECGDPHLLRIFIVVN